MHFSANTTESIWQPATLCNFCAYQTKFYQLTYPIGSVMIQFPILMQGGDNNFVIRI